MAWNDFLKNYQMQGSTPLMMNYGINTLANKFNKYAGNNRNTNYNQSLTDWGSPMGGVPDEPMMPPMLDQTGQMGASNYRGPQGVFPETENLISPFMEEPSGVGEGYDRRGIGNIIKDKISGFTTPVMSALRGIGDKFQRTPEKQAAYDAITGGQSLGTNQFTRGKYGGNEYELYRSPGGLKVGSNILGYGEGFEKNFDSGFGSRSLEEMEQKKLDWALARYNKLGRKGLGTRIYNELAKSGMIDDRTGADPITQERGAWEPTPGRDYSARELSNIGREHYTGKGMAFEARPSGTFTTPSGKRGYTGGRAEGGRIGYQEGELVEDESMMEATPTGMMEENIEEVQGEPTREQLEAIALEIFRLPLEQLNEQQLEVVYQAAMEQEPSEEEVQFAAQEGPGEGIASLV